MRKGLLNFGHTLTLGDLDDLFLSAMPTMGLARLPTSIEAADADVMDRSALVTSGAEIAVQAYRTYVAPRFDALRVLYYARAYSVLSVAEARRIIWNHKVMEAKAAAEGKMPGSKLVTPPRVVAAVLRSVGGDSGYKAILGAAAATEPVVAAWFDRVLLQLGGLTLEARMVPAAVDASIKQWGAVAQQPHGHPLPPRWCLRGGGPRAGAAVERDGPVRPAGAGGPGGGHERLAACIRERPPAAAGAGTADVRSEGRLHPVAGVPADVAGLVFFVCFAFVVCLTGRMSRGGRRV